MCQGGAPPPPRPPLVPPPRRESLEADQRLLIGARGQEGKAGKGGRRSKKAPPLCAPCSPPTASALTRNDNLPRPRLLLRPPPPSPSAFGPSRFEAKHLFGAVLKLEYPGAKMAGSRRPDSPQPPSLVPPFGPRRQQGKGPPALGRSPASQRGGEGRGAKPEHQDDKVGPGGERGSILRGLPAQKESWENGPFGFKGKMPGKRVYLARVPRSRRPPCDSTGRGPGPPGGAPEPPAQGLPETPGPSRCGRRGSFPFFGLK